MEQFFTYIIIPLFIGFGFGFLVGKAKRNPKPKDISPQITNTQMNKDGN